jgi:hypothetical protein
VILHSFLQLATKFGRGDTTIGKTKLVQVCHGTFASVLSRQMIEQHKLMDNEVNEYYRTQFSDSFGWLVLFGNS